MNGPFSCGSYSDLRIFRKNLRLLLIPGELVVADGTYKGNRCKNRGSAASNCLYGIMRARYDTCNKRIKEFDILGQRFRHNITKHGACNRAVAKMSQLMIRNGHPLFYLRKHICRIWTLPFLQLELCMSLLTFIDNVLRHFWARHVFKNHVSSWW